MGEYACVCVCVCVCSYVSLQLCESACRYAQLLVYVKHERSHDRHLYLSDGKLQWEEEAHVDRDNSNEVNPVSVGLDLVWVSSRIIYIL